MNEKRSPMFAASRRSKRATPAGAAPRRRLPMSASAACATLATLLVHSAINHIANPLRQILASALAFVIATSTVHLSRRWDQCSVLERQVDAYLLCVGTMAIVRIVFDISLIEMVPAFCLAGWLFQRMFDAAWFDDLDRLATDADDRGEPRS